MRQIPARYSEDWMDTLDGRSKFARELKTRLECLQADLGGIDNLSYQQQSLCKRIIYLEAMVESMEAKLGAGQTIDSKEYVGVVNTLKGVFLALGLRRQAKELSLEEYLQLKDKED